MAEKKTVPCSSGDGTFAYQIGKAVCIVTPNYPEQGETVHKILLNLMRKEIENP